MENDIVILFARPGSRVLDVHNAPTHLFKTTGYESSSLFFVAENCLGIFKWHFPFSGVERNL